MTDTKRKICNKSHKTILLGGIYMCYLMEKPKYIVYNNNDEPIALFFDAVAALNYIYTINGAHLEPIIDEDINE